MIVFMIIIGYIMSFTMLTGKNGSYNNIYKIHMALLMGSSMANVHYGLKGDITPFIISIIITIALIVVIRKNINVNDEQFLRGMIEHHDMALFMAEFIRNKTKNSKIKDLADNIIASQQKEINEMKSWL